MPAKVPRLEDCERAKWKAVVGHMRAQASEGWGKHDKPALEGEVVEQLGSRRWQAVHPSLHGVSLSRQIEALESQTLSYPLLYLKKTVDAQ